MSSEMSELSSRDVQTYKTCNVEPAMENGNPVQPIVVTDIDEGNKVKDSEAEEALARDELLAQNHSRMLLLVLVRCVGAWSLLCLALTINHWAAYLCFSLLAMYLWLVALGRTYEVIDRNTRIAEQKSALRGQKRARGPILPWMLFIFIIGSFSKFAGSWVMLRWKGGQLFEPDGQLSSAAVELQMMFGVYAAFGLLTIAIYLACLVLWRKKCWRSKDSENIDLNTEPEVS